jgi:hypothetical protein
LIDLGFSGHPFTWKRGNLQERLDRVLSNMEWQERFPSSAVIHISIPSSDHCGLFLQLSTDEGTPRRNYFKFLRSWLEHPDFASQVKNSWMSSNPWTININNLTNNL